MRGGGNCFTVAVADAQPLLLDGLRAAVDGDPQLELAAAASTPLELAAALAAQPVDVTVVGLGRDDAADAWLAAVSPTDRGTRVLVLMDAIDDDGLLSWLRAGASGLVSRAIGAEELVAAVRGVAAGATYLGPAAQDAMLAGMRRLAVPVAPALTVREGQVLAHLAEGKSTAAIGQALFLGQNTIKTHLHHIYEKLGVSNRTGAVREGMRRGLLR